MVRLEINMNAICAKLNVSNNALEDAFANVLWIGRNVEVDFSEGEVHINADSLIRIDGKISVQTPQMLGFGVA